MSFSELDVAPKSAQLHTEEDLLPVIKKALSARSLRLTKDQISDVLPKLVQNALFILKKRPLYQDSPIFQYERKIQQLIAQLKGKGVSITVKK